MSLTRSRNSFTDVYHCVRPDARVRHLVLHQVQTLQNCIQQHDAVLVSMAKRCVAFSVPGDGDRH